MNTSFYTYKNLILFGGGILAERLFQQNAAIRDNLIAVIDMLPEEKRILKSFHGKQIVNPDAIDKETLLNSAIIFAIGNVNVCSYAKDFVKKYNIPARNLFVVNPYSSLRFFMVNEELANETRIPLSDERYSKVKSLFNDDLSLKIWNALYNSKPFESNDDSYELVRFADIEDLYYYKEDYWATHSFTGTTVNDATILDCGAYIGDSLIDICQAIPEKTKHYYAFEPLKENIDQILSNKDLLNYCEDIVPLEYGVGEFDENKLFGYENNNFDGARFVSEEGTSSYSELRTLQIRSIDSLDIPVKGTLYIKMDIEGSELAALKGAIKTIKKHHPYLAICLYHRKNDLINIPLFINSLGLSYNFHLRGGYHTILWAIPK